MEFSEATHDAGTIPQSHHHAGDVDDVSHYHALQDLTGVVTWLPGSDDTAIVHVAIMSAIIDAFAEADAVRLERPPKSVLPI